MGDRRVKVRETARALSISNKLVYSTLHQYLNLKQLSTSWVQLILLILKKSDRGKYSKDGYSGICRKSSSFRHCEYNMSTLLHALDQRTDETMS